ncbi:YheC/YheD family protein [Tepidibacillus marianensis]|uniref:YheC/YheD family protein n=1 Tax=Tepidibacillus marianensis TaxID=3131995 RepID=UPI00338F3128
MVFTKKFLIQPWINLKEYENQICDIRVSIQKNRKNKWVMSGIVCRMAQNNKIATNIFQGKRPFHIPWFNIFFLLH